MKLPGCTLSFSSLISAYAKIQSSLVSQIRYLATNISSANPGSFILLQFQMGQVTQIGETISNLISNINSMIATMVRNQK